MGGLFLCIIKNMKTNHEFNFWVFAMGIAALLIGSLRVIVAWRYLRCDVWGLGTQCMPPQTALAGHVLLDVINVLLDLFLVGLGLALIIHTVRPLFKSKFAPQPLPPFLGDHIQKFYLSHPVSKIATKIAIGIMIFMCVSLLAIALWGTIDFVTGSRHIPLTVVLALTSLIPLAGIWRFYRFLKRPLFCVSEEGLQYEETQFIRWTDVKQLVCSKKSKQGGVYLELRTTKETKPKWLLRPQNSLCLDEYYMLSIAQREVFKQALGTYIPVVEE